MREALIRALLLGRSLLNPCLGPLVLADGEDVENGDRAALKRSEHSGGGPESDEDSSAARLSRRSSVLVDLISLFRRSSSSIGKTVKLPGQHFAESDDEDEEGEPKPVSKEKVLEAIRQKKEVIGKLRSQPWSMKRKRRTLKVAQRYLKRQQSKVSKWHLYKVELVRQLTAFGRWCDNMKIYLIPWEAKIKRIESHYGSVVSSYFTFLRWVLSVNITMTVIVMLFITIPEWLADSREEPGRVNRTYAIKHMKEQEISRADELNTVLDFKGHFEYSLLFYGFYSSETCVGIGLFNYCVPVAYLVVNLVVLGYSFFVILRKMAANAKQSKLTGGKTEQYVFNWKLFTGWDYSVGNPETATNVVMANVNKFREVIAEYNVNMRKKFDCLRLSLRILANVLIFSMQAGSVYAIHAASSITNKTTFIQRNAVSITVSFITLIFPNFFDLISKIERYHPRTTLRLQLGRVLFLYIVNYYTLIVSLMFMLKSMEIQSNQTQLHLQTHNGYFPNGTMYQVAKNRNERQVVFHLPNGVSPFNESHFELESTTPAPGKPWTTVFPNFGPFAISNPKVVVLTGVKNAANSSTFYTQPIGNADWTKNTDTRPTPLNYSTSVKAVAQRLTTDWYEECWENLIGQEITKLVTMDLVMTIVSILFIDFFRGLWVRYCNLWWFWNLECTFPEYGEFKVAENVLHLVNNQGMIWLGLFFVPMLPAINNLKLIILMYIRGWAVMTCNVPARQIFRASRSSNFYLMLLLLMLFLCTLPVGYVIVAKTPSKICGPFGGQLHFYSLMYKILRDNLNQNLVEAIVYLTSPGIVIPVLLLLLLVIYFLFALVRGLREANSDLSNQLMRERTEEKKKIFELAGGKKRSVLGKKNGYRQLLQRKGKSRGGSDEEEDSPQSSKDHHSFVPSLKSVNEADNSDSEEGEKEGNEPEASPPPPPAKPTTFKEKLLSFFGLGKSKKNEVEQEPLVPDLEQEQDAEDSSPLSAKKSLQGTSEDQQSYSSMSESYTSQSHSDEQSYTPSFHDCASTLQDNASATRVERAGTHSKSTSRHDHSGTGSAVIHSGEESDSMHDSSGDHSSLSENAFKPDPNTLQVPSHGRKSRHSPASDTAVVRRHSKDRSVTPRHYTSVPQFDLQSSSSAELQRPSAELAGSEVVVILEGRGSEAPSEDKDGRTFGGHRPTPVPHRGTPVRQPEIHGDPADGRPESYRATPVRGTPVPHPEVSSSQHSGSSRSDQNTGSVHSVVLPAITPTQQFLGLADPRLSYADPYSSYANAMMCPVMEMQSMPPLLSASDADDDEERSDERTRLITPDERPKVKEKERKRSKEPELPSTSKRSSTSKPAIRPPRFRISSSPKGRVQDASESDTSTSRQFIMRVKKSDEDSATSGGEATRSAHRSKTSPRTPEPPDAEDRPPTTPSSSDSAQRRSQSAAKARHKHTYV